MFWQKWFNLTPQFVAYQFPGHLLHPHWYFTAYSSICQVLLGALSDYFGLTLDELVRDVDVADVRAKNLNSEKLDSIYNDVGTAKKFIKWYLIIAGTGAGVVLVILLSFILRAAFVW